ncbi:MAG: diacylglycerol/lipid kinase family protein [Bacteroidales bacterium]
MTATVIINPVAGGRARLAPERRVAIAREALARAEMDGRVVVSERPGHGRDLAREAVASGCRVVVAWGGDGTVNEVAAELAGTEAALGIVRAGSGNGVARELGVPADPHRALLAALTGPEHAIDTGEIDGRFFLNIAGIGFDATMALQFNGLGTERRGALRYSATVFRSVFAYRAAQYRLELDGEVLESRALVLAVANLPQYGARAVIAPHAAPFDGMLDVVVIGDRGPLGRAGLVPRLFDQSIGKAGGVTLRTTRRVVVTSDEPMAYHIDGEPFRGGHRLEAAVRPASLRFKGAGRTRWPAFFGERKPETGG